VATIPNEITVEDRYGETRVIHRTQHGLKLRRQHKTPALVMSQTVSRLIGERIRRARLAKGMNLQDLALRAGMGSGSPKQRIWAIENATRGHGMRLGTLYALAMVLEVEPATLLPTAAEAASAAGIEWTGGEPQLVTS
jgi:hypothetical protein